MLKLNQASLSFKHVNIIDNVDLEVNRNETIGLIGPNGSGKTSLFKVLGGSQKLNSGTLEVKPGISIGYMPQELIDYYDLTAMEYLLEISGIKKLLEDFNSLLENLDYSNAEQVEEYDVLLEKITRVNAYEFENKVLESVKKVGLTEKHTKQIVKQLSGGEKNKLALLAILIASHDVILLDEPTNNLDKAGLKILSEFIKNSANSFVIISHDRFFLEETVTKIWNFETEKFNIVSYNLSYVAFLEHRAKELEKIKIAYTTYLKTKKLIEEDLTTRQNKIDARDLTGVKITDNEKMAAGNKGDRSGRNEGSQLRMLREKLEKLVEPPKPVIYDKLSLAIHPGKRLGDTVINVEKVSYRTDYISLGPINFQLAWGEKVVLTGPNGAGKTTLSKLILGQLKPNSGEVILAPQIKIADVSQDLVLASDRSTVWETFKLETGNGSEKSRAILSKLGFSSDDLSRLASQLSPGQRSRLMIANLIASSPNFILLDEPTNHLDLGMLGLLESMMKDYEGSSLIITHDRKFIENIKPDKIIELNYDGKIKITTIKSGLDKKLKKKSKK